MLQTAIGLFITGPWTRVSPSCGFIVQPALPIRASAGSTENLYVCVTCSVVSDSLWSHGLLPSRLLCPWNSPGKNAGVGLLFPSSGDLPDPGIEPLCCRQILYHLSHQRSPDWEPAKSLQSCPTLHDPMDCSPSGSSVHGIFQARVLEWGAIAFSSRGANEQKNESLQPRIIFRLE